MGPSYRRTAFVWITLLFLVIIYGFEAGLSLRELSYVRNQPFPSVFSELLSLSDFELQRAMRIGQISASLIHQTAWLASEAGLLLFGFLPWLWRLVQKWTPQRIERVPVVSEILRSLAFILVYAGLGRLLAIPLNCVLELLYGVKEAPVDWSYILVIVIFTVSLVGLYRCNSKIFFAVAASIFVVSTVAGTLINELLIRFTSKYRPFTMDSLGVKLKELTDMIGFSFERLYMTDKAPIANAYHTGSLIVVYAELIRKFTIPIVVATVAHELGHWHYGHAWKQILLLNVAAVLFCIIAHVLVRWDGMYAGFGFHEIEKTDEEHVPQSAQELSPAAEPSSCSPLAKTASVPTKRKGPNALLVGLLCSQYLFAPLLSATLYGFKFRQHLQEFQADAFAVNLGHGRALSHLFVQIHAEQNAVASDPIFDATHSTHPCAVNRIKAIEQRRPNAFSDNGGQKV